MSFAATACPSSAASGESPFSKRPDASVRRPESRVDVRWMFGPFQFAASMRTRVVAAPTSSARRP